MKKEILRTLKVGLNKEIFVLPMFTDEFSEENLAFYKNITSCDGIKQEIFKRETNKNLIAPYFKLDQTHAIIFIDPDKGIKEHQKFKPKDSSRKADRHLCLHFDEVEEVAKMCELLVIYDQSFDSRKENRIMEIESKLKLIKDRNLHGFYLNTQTCFAFISRDNELLQRAKRLLIEQKVVMPSRLVTIDENQAT